MDMNDAKQKDLVTIFANMVDKKGNLPFLWEKKSGQWISQSWKKTADSAVALAEGLQRNGLAPGDRVMLVSESRKEWPSIDLAIMAAGGITVPAYTTNYKNEHLHVLEDCGANWIIVSNQALLDRVLPAAEECLKARQILVLDEFTPPETNIEILRIEAIVTKADGNSTDKLRALSENLNGKSIACLIYTSGTGGTPKGVICQHQGIMSNCRDASRILTKMGLEDEVFLSFLPLSHSYEHTAGQFWPISIGAQIYYAESIDKLASNIQEVRPTLMSAVPRLYESMRDRILRGIKRQSRLKALLFRQTIALGQKRFEGKSLTAFEKLQDILLEKIVRKKVADRFGGRLKAFISGGAPLNYEVGIFFIGLGIRILQGYGQTESGPVISVNPPTGYRIDSVGIPFSEAEVKIANDGEILVKGDLVMQGYWGQEAATSDTIVDGWLHTGDVGVIDPDGHIRITDRKKDIIVNSGGDNISPQRVEGFLVAEPEIHQAMVYGDKRPHLVALIIPDADFAREWSESDLSHSEDLVNLMENHQLRAAMGRVLERVNSQLNSIERVRRFILSSQELTIENEMMTPTLKIRRHKVREKFSAQLEALYGS